ncbi:hypothetical protein, partial [Acinetobacter nosocomialis]|uniref:hypothetical protein n=1 Tax=Acinetobacter nosocomialis TaxID=106654 RepID=UPI003AF96A32
ALMVVWGYPCESKSSPAHYSKHPHSKEWGCFLLREINRKHITKNQIYTAAVFQRYNEEAFNFGMIS